MSYCVNCGVELEKTEKRCPLCGVEVRNPLQPYDEKAVRPYPRRLDPIHERINRHFAAAIISICMAFPAVLSLAVDIIINFRISWSIYVAGGLALTWIMIVPYFLYKKPTLTKILLPDATGMLLLLLLVSRMQTGDDWFLPLAMPVTLILCSLVFINGILIERQIIQGFVIPAAILISIGLLAMGIDLCVKGYLTGQISLGWSFFVLIPSVAIAAAFLTVARRQSIREEINRRLHL